MPCRRQIVRIAASHIASFLKAIRYSALFETAGSLSFMATSSFSLSDSGIHKTEYAGRARERGTGAFFDQGELPFAASRRSLHFVGWVKSEPAKLEANRQRLWRVYGSVQH
jgi:hypothetical protein